eukprot:103264_1
MSSVIGENGYQLRIFILMVSSGTLCLFSLPQLSIGVYKICIMKKLRLPKAIFYSSILSLFAAYLVMFTIFLLSIFAYIFVDTDSNPSDQHDGGKRNDLYLNRNRDEIPLFISIGISIIEFFFIISKFSVNFLFLCRLYYSFKGTLFHYSILKLLPLFILITIELIIYILFSEVIIVYIVNEYEFKKLNKIFLSSYHCIDIIVRITFILLFERGLYRLATSRSFKSNLRLFGFGGASIDQIELSCKPQSKSVEKNSLQSPLKDQVNKNKSDTSNVNSMADETGSKITSPDSNYLHPLSYQLTDRAEKFTLAEVAIPEGNEPELEEESNDINELDFDINKSDFVFMDDELPQNSTMDMCGTNTPSNVSVVSFQSVRSNSTKIGKEEHDYKIEFPPCIDEGDENELEEHMDVVVDNINHNALKLEDENVRVVSDNGINIETTTLDNDKILSPKSVTNTNEESFNRRNSHGRSTSQINDLLSMSQMGSGHHKKRSSFAAINMKYFNSSSFDRHTKDLVKLVTKFSVLVVWSTVTSIFAAIFFISFVIGFNDNQVLQNISASYIALIICFVEMHIVYLQLNGTEKWYKCLCSLCHKSWGKCCVCKLRRRLVRKIGKQHKALTIKEQQSKGKTQNVKLKRESYKE